MIDKELSELIYAKALECGFDKCGIIALADIDGYKQRLDARKEAVPESAGFYQKFDRFTQLQEIYPWAEAIIVCATWQGKYRYPQSLQGKYAKTYMLSESTIPGTNGSPTNKAFETWLNEHGIRFEGGESYGASRNLPLRYAAVAAGLGIFRKNNFFYAEKGSYYRLEGYVIDKRCEYKHTIDIRPCPDACNLCQRSCKTHALRAPFTMNPLQCVSFWTTFGLGNIPEGLQEEQFDAWICGCDACQDACPFNRHDWSVGKAFPGLEEIEALLQPENIVTASDEILIEKVVPKTDMHVFPDQVDTFRKTAARAIRNLKKNK